ncbi:tail protein (tape measure) [Serratia marcescens]|uniref:tail protein (tape measure) n=1 Tax=Serratia marcescens TaxID=615 RepID=UPI000D94FE8E|nr:tail protein (tape measure) [Serratia marcescens]EME1466147.1 tail protein (tape measure) [Serratia marcescens]PYA07264.1 tail protein (tape measure) [Serratia marcescens]
MAEQDGGKLVYEVDIDVAPLLSGSNKAKAELASLGDAANDTAPGFEKLSKGAKGVASALAMPEVNKLSTQLAQLSGKIGASSESATVATDSQNKFHGALSTVANQLGAGYVSNVGSATSALIKHAKEAIAATNAQLENAVAAKKEATALQESATQLVTKAAAEKNLAEEATNTATSELKVAEAVFARKEADIASLEALLVRQKESLRQSEANLEITNSEKAVAQALRDRNAVETTQAKIIKQSNQAVKEVTAAEDRVKAAKLASATASEKLTQSIALEAVAVATVAKANDAATIATERLTTASKVQAAAVSGARGALALLGGPSGILLLAAAGVYSLYQAMNDTSKIEKYKQEIDDAAKRTEYLTKVQADAALAKTKIRLDIDQESLKGAEAEVEAIKNSINTIKSISGSPKLIADLEKDLTLAKEKASEFADSVRVANDRIEKFTQQSRNAGEATTATAIANEVYDKSMKGVIESNVILEKAIHGSLAAAEEMAAEKSLRKALAETGVSADETEKQVAKLKAALGQKTELTFEQELKSVEQNIAALRLEMVRGKEAAIEYRATIAAANKGLDPEQTKMYVDAKKEEFELTKKLSDQKKKETSDRSSAKRDANAAESVAQKLANLKQQADLAAESTSELSRAQAILNAQQSLGKGATQAQIAEAGAYAAKKWDTANAIKAQAAAEKLLPEAKENASYAQDVKDLSTALAAKKISQEQYNTTAEQLEQQHQVNLAKIRAEAVVSPQQQAAGMVDPVQQLANENAQKLALIQQFETDKGKITQRGIELMNAANKQYEQQRTAAQWEILSQQSLGYNMLTSAVDAFSGNASNAITGLLTGTMSAQEAMRSLGNTILNSVINSIVQVGVEALKNYILGQTLGAASVASSVGMAATTASAWAPAAAMASLATLGANAAPAAAGITSTVGLAGGLALAGARYNGGPVSAGAMYQVGERGKPEIYQASTGKQYMIPGDNGQVISNKDMQGGGGINVNVSINNTNGSYVDHQVSSDGNGGVSMEIFIADMDNGGPMSQAISRNHQAPRRATQ